MALHLIIDGYNLIRQVPDLQRLDARDLEAGRTALLARLAGYLRRGAVQQITVVFDGWHGGGLTEGRDRFQGLAIIYSRRGEKADEVIKRLLLRERGRAVVVSSDREIQDCAREAGAAWVGAPQFAARHLAPGTDSLPEDSEAVSPPRGLKKGPARRLPKRQRQRQQRLKKL